MSDKKGDSVIILIIFIIDFSTVKQTVWYNYSLTIRKRIFLKSLFQY